MQLNIEIPAEIESSLTQQAAEEGIDVASFVRKVLDERLAMASQPATKRHLSHAEFRRSLHEIIDLHAPSKAGVDDSRESIYAGRGE